MIIQRILQLAVLCGAIHLYVYGSTKPPAGTNAPPRMTMARPAARPPEPPPAGADMVIVGAGTNETWCFAPPDGATVVETWRRRGAANERVAVGCPHPVDGPMSIDTCGRVTTPRRVYSPLGRQVGMVPEARWADLGRESRAWWMATASNSSVVCWQNALLGRDTNTPVSVRAEFFADGRFEYRYDRSSTGECVTSLRGELIGEIVSRIAAGATNGTHEIVADELKSTKLWGRFAFAADPGTNALCSRTFEIDRKGGWTSYFISSRGDAALCTCGEDATGGWSLDGTVVEWEDDTGTGGTVTESPEGDSWHLPVATNATRVTITLRATDGGMTASVQQQGLGGGHASPTLYLLEYSPRLEFGSAQEVEGADGKTYFVYTDASDMSLSVDESNRPCRAPAGEGEATADDFAMPTEPGVYRLPTGERVEPDRRPMPLMAPRLGAENGGGADGERYLVLIEPSVSYGTAHYACSWTYPLDWSWHGSWCSCEPGVSSGIEGHSCVDAYIDWYDEDDCLGVVEVGGEVVWWGEAHHVVWPCPHGGHTPYCPCGCDESCPHCACLRTDGPSRGSIRFKIGLGQERGLSIGYAWFESDGPVTVSPQLFEVDSRPDAYVREQNIGGTLYITAYETGGRDLVISALTNGVVVEVKHHGETDPFETWEITNVDGSPSVVRLVKRGGGGTPPPPCGSTSGQQQEEVGAIREDWTYSCSWQSGEWVWDVTDNRTIDPPPRGESVEVIDGTNFVFGSDGQLQRLTVGTNDEAVVVRTIGYDDDGRVVLVDDGTNGCVTIAYDAAGNVSEMTGPEGTLRAAWDENGVMTNLDTSAWNGPTPNANPPLMAPRPRLLGSGGGITVAEAIRHYLNGNGSPITLPFSVVDTSSATPIKFDCVRNFVSSCHEPGDYHIVGTNYFPAIGKPRLVLGDVPVKLDGTITYTGQCNWTFRGTMSGAEDPYDFNAGNRGLLGEALTALGRALLDGRGTPYVFQFSGSVPLDGSGHCGDR